MPIVLVFAGALFLASAIAGTTAGLAGQLRSDFTGPGNFLYWIAAFGLVGAVGYVPGAERFSRAFVGLLLLAMFLANGTGVFSRLGQALSQPPAPAGRTDAETSGSGSPAGAGTGAGASAGTGAGNGVNTAQAASAILSVFA